MALIKIYATLEKRDNVVSHISHSVKLIASAALNVPEIPTNPSGIETVFIEGVDLVGIDYIVEIIAVERPNQQAIANNFINGLNAVYPKQLFSVYFNNISKVGMANTPRAGVLDEQLTMDEAIQRSKDEI